jgi:MarR family transcriptional regulator, transcriptional regulator for hemolysin
MRQAKSKGKKSAPPSEFGAGRYEPLPLPDIQEGRRRFLESGRYHEAGSREDLNFQFTSAVMALGRRWRNRLNEELALIGQTQARWESLFWIEAAGGHATQSEVAQRVGIEGPTFARMLDRLEKEKLVVRRASKSDRRTKTIALCKGAAPRLKEISDMTDRLRSRLLEDVDPVELAACIAVIRRIILPKLEQL